MYSKIYFYDKLFSFSRNDFFEGNDFSEQLKMSEEKVQQLSVEISSLKNLHDIMQQQIEELKGIVLSD